MPITLRNVRPDAAAKLRQLEVGAAAVDRAARDLIPAELQYQRGPPLADRMAVKAKAVLGPASHAVSSSLAVLVSALPYAALAIRIIRRLLADALLCISLSAAVLLVLTLVVAILAPPV